MIASIAAVRIVHLVGHSGFKPTPQVLASKFYEKRCDLLGDNLSSLRISLQSSRVSLRETSFCPASCRQRMSETVYWESCRLFIGVAIPFLFPCIFAVPSHSCPRHNASGRLHRMGKSLITFIQSVCRCIGHPA